MSKNLEKVIQRAISDAAFRRQLQSNPEAALRGFQLTDDEVAALRSGDAGKLTSFGIDQRMSKTFSFGAADGATRSVIGDDLSASASTSSRDLRLNSDLTPGYTAEGGQSGTDETASVGDPMSRSTASSILRDPENPANARGYIGGEVGSASSNASILRDPENPANARGYIGGEAAAPTSDAVEDQSHAFAATRSADVTGAGAASSNILRDPENPANARGYIGGEAAPASSNASILRDPENPANARGYIGGEAAAPTSDAIEDQSHAFAATRSADVTGAGAASSNILRDPENPANARGYIGGEATAPTSDALEDQSHAFASRSDAFLTDEEGRAYSADANWRPDQAEEATQALNPDASTAIVEDTASVHHEPDIPI
jgi:hypothetical protein